jgi:uncharacterized protein (TIGR00255 family)
MTGYGRCEKVTREYKVTVEIKSVNHRYCDLNIKLPKKFNALESKIRGIMKEYANRGKIDIYINFENYADSDVKVQYHPKLAADYVAFAGRAAKEFGLEANLTAASLLRFPEVTSLEEDSTGVEEVFPTVEEAVREAGRQFAEARQTEGAHLKEDILVKLGYLLELVSFVEERSPKILAEYREKIQSKVQEFLGDEKIDEGVLATELVVFADKVCVDEETVRLRSHIHHMQTTLEKEEPIGRKLDFIAQEMNREANTILSKANDKELSQNAIELKTEIEKIREQIQNIE